MTSKAGKQAPFLHGVPIVASTTERDALFATPDTDQRVMIRGTGDEWSYSGTSWFLSKLGLKGGAGGVFNVLSYGATGDGATDDRAAIQSAIDACIAAGGGVVYFPKGTYYLNSYRPSQTKDILTCSTNFSGTVVRPAFIGAPGSILTTPLYYNVNSAETVTLNIGGDIEDCLVYGLTFKNTHPACAGRQCALGFGGGSNNVTKRVHIEKCVFRDHARTIAASGVEGLTIIDNDFLFTNGRDSGTTNLADPSVAIWCFVQSNGQTSDVRIIGNRFDGCTDGSVSGNTVSGAQDGLVYGMARGWAVIGNSIKRFGVEAIYIWSRKTTGLTEPACATVITGNTIDSALVTGEVAGQYSIRCDEDNATIRDNTLVNTQNGVWVSGLSQAVTVSRVSVGGNHIYMRDSADGVSDVGIYFAAASDIKADNNHILWNTATTSQPDIAGIKCQSLARAKITDNVVRAGTNPATKTLHGFYFDSASLSEIECSGNTTDNCDNDFYSSAASTTNGAVAIGTHTTYRATNYVNAGGTLGTFTNVAPRPPVEAYPGVNSFTYTPRVSAPVQRITGTLTGNQTVTLSTTGAIHGDQASFVKTTSAGAFTTAIGALKTIPASTAARVDITYDRTNGWQLSGYQLL